MARPDNRGRDEHRGNDNRVAAPDNHGPANNPAFNRGPANNNRPGFANNRPGPNDNHGNFNGNNHRPNPAYTRYHRNFNASRHFRGPNYVRPSGWYSHRWTYGEFLPSLFWTSNYWLSDYRYYGLTPPPPGTVWVRDGYDALLIDRYDGQIIQVAYDVFY